MNARLSTLIAILALAMLTVQTQASVLTFDGATNAGAGYWGANQSVTLPTINDPTLPLYGDHVNSLTQGTVTSPNAYSYGGTYGLTPDIGIAYGPGDPTHNNSSANPIPVWYPINFGDLTNVVYQVDQAIGSGTPSVYLPNLTLSITLTADPGHLVKLESFDLAAFTGTGNNNLDSLEIIVDGTPHELGPNLTISSIGHTSFDFTAAPYIGSTVEIFMDGRDTSHYSASPNPSFAAFTNFTDIGIDNVAFGEITPEPASLGLLACGSLLLLRRRKR